MVRTGFGLVLGVGAGGFRHRIRAEGHQPVVTRPIDLRADATVRVSLQCGVEVSGTLVDGAGKPRRGRVGWLTHTGDVLHLEEAYADGRVVLEGGLPPGPTRLIVRLDDRAPIVKHVVVPAERERVELRIDVR